jgi:hypothetical protein
MARNFVGLRGVLLATVLLTGAFGQQAFYGVIVGDVTDSSGGAVVNAAVSVTNLDQGVTLKVVTNHEGSYEILNLTPGRYSVKVEAPGFQTFVREAVDLAGGQQMRINAQLPVGAVSQEVLVVAGSSPQINTETATTAIAPITHHATVTLPNTGTAFTQFPDIYNQLLYGYANVYNSAFSIGGALSSQNGEIQDGMRIEGQSDIVGGNRGLARPSIDSVDEVIVTTSNPSAKYPNPSAIETVMKSGTNAFHGSLWYSNSNTDLNAAQYLSHTHSLFLEDQYGGSLGGPVIKNKTFFFFSYQGFYNPAGIQGFSSVPTAKMKAGDFSDFLDPAYLKAAGIANPIQLYNPYTGQPFPNNQIPAAMQSQVALNALKVYPDPNFSVGKGYVQDYFLTGLLLRKESNFDTRVDHYFTPREHLYGRFTYFHSPNGATQSGIPGFGGNAFIENARILTVHFTSTVSSGLLNHLMVGYFRNHTPTSNGYFDTTATPWNSKLGISGVPSNQDAGFPYFTFSQTALTQPVSYNIGEADEDIWHVRDDVTWNRGRHTVSLGFEFRHDRQGNPYPGPSQTNNGSCAYGCMTFNGSWTAGPGSTGLDFADFLLGLPYTSQLQLLSPPDFRNRQEWGAFAQDDIKVNSRFNLSLGLRYDYFPTLRSENDLAAVFSPMANAIVVPSAKAVSEIPKNVILTYPVLTAAQAGLPSTLIGSVTNDFGPRVGAAYRVANNMVVRAGFGVYHTPLTATGKRLLSGPFSATSTFPSLQPTAGSPPVLTMANPYSTAGKGSPLINFFAPSPGVHPDTHYDWNLTIERQFGANAFTVEYQGKKSIVPWAPNLNAVPASTTPFSLARLPYPTLGTVTGLLDGAHYNYNALSLEARRRFAAGLFFDVSYVFARAIDDLGGISGETAGSSEDPFNRLRDHTTSTVIPPQRMTVNYVYQLPFGRPGSMLALPDQGAGKVINYLIKGWETAGTYNFQTAVPLTPTTTYRNANGQAIDAPNVNRTSGRPNCTGVSFSPTSDQVAQGYLFNPLAFSNTLVPGTFGSCGKGILWVNPGSITQNQSLYRNFRLPWPRSADHQAMLRLGAQVFNVLNRQNSPAPVVNMDSPFFGKRTNNVAGDTTRSILLMGRIDF